MTWLDPAVLIPDEFHHAAASSWAKVLRAWAKAFLIGMTATPCRLDGLGLQPFCDALVLGPQISEVVPDYLCRAELFEIPPNIDLKELRGSGRDYSQKRLGAMQTGPVIADAVKNWRRLAYDRRTLFFAVDINHSKSIVERLRSIGVSAEHVDFKTSNLSLIHI